MNRLKRLFAYLLALVGIITLASCGKSISGEIESLSATRDTITINAIFDQNNDLTEERAKPHASIYEKDGDKYKDRKEDKNLTMSGRGTAGKATFSNLDPNKTYKVTLFVSIDGKEYDLGSKEATTLDTGTSADNPFMISTKEDFLSMEKDPDGFYKLANDIDFKNEIVDDIFDSSTKFMGSFDGDNHKLMNLEVKNASNGGLFGYTSGATIKNLTIENAKISITGGRPTANLAILIGRAEDTIVDNIKLVNPIIEIAGNSTADINLGFVIGYVENGRYTNIKVTGAKMNVTRVRLNMNIGLFAGVLKGNPIKGEDRRYVENVLVEGEIKAHAYYPNSKGSANIGGFVGATDASGIIKNTAALVDILVTKELNPSYSDEYDLAVGGFVGYNKFGNINVEASATVADIKVYAGDLKEEDHDYSLNRMSKNPVYVGGFAGLLMREFSKVKDCAYIEKSAPILTSMLNEVEEDVKNEDTGETTKEMKKLLYTGLACGYTNLESQIINMLVKGSADYEAKSLEIVNKINEALK